ncbi:putative 2,4-dienoyl-CoA reductase [Planctomycetes bacterium Poly30]|uniref:Putative 2,4-dienoyl-CoA reductase n=1 Tax=Saltatorellus ferox TaxID=2528018 RepID=A0A518EW76_9BACT|nr:putative 2,4-dienoyl-CoA reductase [Planctomycetes bacterium Poly30]
MNVPADTDGTDSGGPEHPSASETAGHFLPAGTFAGKRVVVTGGGTGLGLEMSRGFAALGAHVIIPSRTEANQAAFLEEAQARGWQASGAQVDVREPDSVRRLADSILEEHGPVDVLVNNAAGNFVCPAERMSSNAWRAVLGIVLDGTFYCSKEFGKHMMADGRGGSIINIIATYAWTGMPGVVHSASAKAGVHAMGKTLAAEWARYGIRVNAIAPGPFESGGANKNLWPNEAVQERIRASVPLKRFATREEVAAQALWLASDAGQYVTGATITIDGGMSLGAGMMWEPGERVGRPKTGRSSEGGAS